MIIFFSIYTLVLILLDHNYLIFSSSSTKQNIKNKKQYIFDFVCSDESRRNRKKEVEKKLD